MLVQASQRGTSPRLLHVWSTRFTFIAAKKINKNSTTRHPHVQTVWAFSYIRKHSDFTTKTWSGTKLSSPHIEVLFSSATLIQSRGLFLQAGLEHTVRSSLPSRWARERLGPQGQTLYLKLNDWAEIHQAKAVHLTMLFTKLARDIPTQIGGFFFSLAQHLCVLCCFYLFLFVCLSAALSVWHLLNNPLVYSS